MNQIKQQFSKLTLTLLSLSLSCSIYANQNSSIDNLSFAKIFKLKQPINASISKTSYEDIKKQLWQKYLQDAQNLSGLKDEFNNRVLKFEDKSMRFTFEKRGTAPAEGYPLYIALHGGGNTASSVNDSQWNAMKYYYNGSVTNGIYATPRGISDNWNLHFEQESYPLYDKLIESAVLYENVDPNRVYFVGFSAGGDGVYAITPRMADRLAAANMSAGHNNNLTFDNLYNTPFLLQVGEYDSAYSRNKVTAQNNLKLNDLNTKYSGGYVHDVFVHYNGSHNSWHDNDASRRNQTIIADPTAWLENGDRTKKEINTNAIDWMSQYTRETTPQKIVWDLKVSAQKRVYQTGQAILEKDGINATLAKPKELFYWLDVSVNDTYPTDGKLVAEIDKASNTINVSETTNIEKFRVLLNPDMLNLDAPVNVVIGGKAVGSVNVKQSMNTMARTLFERSDINSIYDAEITLVYNKAINSWSIS